MKSLIFAAVIFVVSLGVACAMIQFKKELHSRMTRSSENLLWTDNKTKANFKEARKICEGKEMRLAEILSTESGVIMEIFIKTKDPNDGKQHSYWVLGSYGDKKRAVIYTTSRDEEDIFSCDIENAETFAKKNRKGGNFEARKALFICEMY